MSPTFVLLWLVLASPIGPAPDALTLSEAETLYPVLDEAYRLYKTKRFDDAIVAFERAYAIRPEPRFVLNIAVSYRDANRCARALASFERFFGVCEGCPELNAARRVQNETRRRCTPPVTIRTQPVDAFIAIDGKAYGSTPLTLDLEVGPHVLRASISGFAPVERGLLVEPNTPAVIDLKLAPEPLLVAATPMVTPAASSGGEAAGLHAWRNGAFIVASVGAITGGAFGLRLVRDLERESSADTRSGQNDAQSAARRDAVVAQIGLGVAIVGAAVGIALLVTDDEAVEVRASPTGTTVSLKF